MSGYAHKSWVCPFWRSDARRRSDGRRYLNCGDRGTASHLGFPTKGDFDAYTDRFCCCAGWKKCSVAIFLSGHYEEENA